MSDRIQFWSCGGGRQSAGIGAFIVQGRIRKPDHVGMVAIEWEMPSTFAYVNKYIRPAMEAMGIPFTYIPRKKYATIDMWSGEDGKSITLPMFTDQSGKASKLPEYCSGEWKREVVLRWAVEQGWKDRGIDNWIGISWDEKHRRRSAKRQWAQPVYPLLDWLPKSTGVSGCLQAVADVGWPEPPRSRCRHCPNQSDDEWLELTPEQLEAVATLEDELRQTDPHLWFHKSCKPLRSVKLKASECDGGLFASSGGCSSGMCF